VIASQARGADALAATRRLVRLTIPAKPEYVSLCRLALTGLSHLGRLPDETLADLKLALTEAASNSVRHAYGEADSGTVEIMYELRPDRLVVEVTDDGPGFAVGGQGGDRGADLTEGGLGIAIIRALTDELEVGDRADGRGSRLRFTKFFDQ
jgi:serine/threonine-protein kinase RsbW